MSHEATESWPEAKEDAVGKAPGGYGLKVMIFPPPPS